MSLKAESRGSGKRKAASSEDSCIKLVWLNSTHTHQAPTRCQGMCRAWWELQSHETWRTYCQDALQNKVFSKKNPFLFLWVVSKDSWSQESCINSGVLSISLDLLNQTLSGSDAVLFIIIHFWKVKIHLP